MLSKKILLMMDTCSIPTHLHVYESVYMKVCVGVGPSLAIAVHLGRQYGRVQRVRKICSVPSELEGSGF